LNHVLFLHNLEETKKFVESVTNDYNYLFGIFTNDSNEHIGNIKVGGIMINIAMPI